MNPRKPVKKQSTAAVFAEAAKRYGHHISTPETIIKAVCLVTILGSALSICFSLKASKTLTTTIPAANSLKNNVNCNDEAHEDLLAQNPRLRLPAHCGLGK